ncbi:hypothetical protein ELG88_09855 [Rhizobium leguminosarum]|uniref:hypothetical protein n=1 Tax=Rhizobium leguminosarum TaxID=384 RepID=UPI001031AA02|nr:hypothetical protein [Rhizobium leguminosarum]TAY66563.1 hypothetical protein ELH82_10380 [Rhizobium leguminosarum]TBF35490.1 hypothetical protein ELG88_09855 [Rhizobium leguminosarum]
MSEKFELSPDDVTLISSTLDLSGASYEDGFLVADGHTATAIETMLAAEDWRDAQAPAQLTRLKTMIKLEIDASAEAERLKYITPGSGQALTYSQKSDEANRYLAATSRVAADYPLLSAEVGITASDISGVAAVVKAAFEQWQIIGARIEASRLRAKASIEEASTEEAVRAAAAAVVWP